MKLKEVFDQLTYGELSQLSIGGGEAGVINESNYARVLAHVNLGLTALHKRFLLKEREVMLALQPGRLTYPIHSSFAASNYKSRETVRYLVDSQSDQFADDIYKIERVYTSKGFEMGLNDKEDPYSLHTPSYSVLQVPAKIVTPTLDVPVELQSATLRIVYRAGHPHIVMGLSQFAPERVNVDIPDSYLEALLLFVASRVHTPTGLTNELNMGNNYSAKYEAECQKLEVYNLRVDQGSQPDRAARNGWV